MESTSSDLTSTDSKNCNNMYIINTLLSSEKKGKEASK